MDWNDYFIYEADTGTLTWKVRPRCHFKTDVSMRFTNKRYAGKIAGSTSIDKNGYASHKVKVNRRMFKASRICYEMAYGPIPYGMQVDHMNLDSVDNRASNLRLATREQNVWNRAALPSNRLGIKGVRKQGDKFQARITANKKRIYLGLFDTEEMAKAAYNKAATMQHGCFAHD